MAITRSAPTRKALAMANWPTGPAPQNALRLERADAALVWSADEDRDLARLTRQQVPVNLAVPASHPLAGITSIATEELADEVIVLFPRLLNPAVWDLFVEHLSPVGPVRLGHVLVVNDLVTDGPRGLVRVVAAGQGLAPTVSAVADDAVVTRPLDPALAVPLDLIQREPARPVLRRAHRAVRGWSLTGYFPGLGGRDTKTT